MMGFQKSSTCDGGPIRTYLRWWANQFFFLCFFLCVCASGVFEKCVFVIVGCIESESL